MHKGAVNKSNVANKQCEVWQSGRHLSLSDIQKDYEYCCPVEPLICEFDIVVRIHVPCVGPIATVTILITVPIGVVRPYLVIARTFTTGILILGFREHHDH